MKLGELLEVTDRKAWRSWLRRNHSKKREVWLVYHRKASGKPRISYNDSVEEALCYGWIDSTVKNVDKERFAQRFSPRKPKSPLSEMNGERVRRLIAQRRMTKAGLAAIARVFDPKEKDACFIVPPDILAGIKANPEAWKNFQKLPEHYKRIRITFIDHYRHRDKRYYQRALRHFIDMTAKNKRFGYVKEMT
jgi:uncharacterized protein YdeI (YjbR/CyaY-like superfamily)